MNTLALSTALTICAFGQTLQPIPDRLVVLTFDDSSKSHFVVARPILKKHKFGATFFITEGFDFGTNKTDYMNWDEITQLHEDGFEIGNHTIDHSAVNANRLDSLPNVIQAINARCREHGIPETVSFAYPGNAFAVEALPVLQKLGIKFARRGGSPEYAYELGRGIAYEPGLDHPLLVPTTGDARPTWTLEKLKSAVSQARYGKIAVLQFHGVPDTAHDWVSTRAKDFEAYMQYLADEKFTVIAMRDLAKYVDPSVAPANPLGVIEDRKKLIAQDRDGSNSRPAKDENDLRYWLENMLVNHRFSPEEAASVVGLTTEEVVAAAKRFGVDPNKPSQRRNGGALLVRPYPGGRHPRIGFRDGAIRPQRETKVSVFAPWDDGGYAVADVPEAVWFESTAKKPELLYLAHTHIPTFWDKQQIALPVLEWDRSHGDALSLERVFPNLVKMTSTIEPADGGVRMEFRVTNNSNELLTGLRVQMCVMLANLHGFQQRTNDNKLLTSPFAACHDSKKERWIIVGWERCGRAWGNPPCPCLHSDPIVEDCPPGESRRVRGWLSFFKGSDVEPELERLFEKDFR